MKKELVSKGLKEGKCYALLRGISKRMKSFGTKRLKANG